MCELISIYERNYEMKDRKSAIRLAAALMLVISMMLSLSSCIIDFGFPFGDYIPDFGDDNGQDGENTPPDKDDDINEDIESENYGDFYPGSGQGDISNLSPITKTLLSTVTIICGSDITASAGSGVIYSVNKAKGDAYIITNQHVIHNSEKISVYLYGMELSAYAIPATLVGGSVTYDIAVLKIENSEILKNSYAIAATLASSDGVRVFDKVYAVGNAEGGGMSATEGIISVDSENISITGADGSLISLRVMRIDAAVNHGNSGGGLYDEQGRLIGIVSAKEVGEDIDNMGYAIPSDLAKNLADSIIYYCDSDDTVEVSKTRKALLGITITAYVGSLEIDPDGKNMYQVEMVEVIEISEGSLAEGKVQVGDIVNSITVDGVKREVTRIHHVTDHMITARAGSTVVLNITRGEEIIDITFEITDYYLSLVM